MVAWGPVGHSLGRTSVSPPRSGRSAGRICFIALGSSTCRRRAARPSRVPIPSRISWAASPGGNVSQIDGLLKSEIAGANLYLLNPSGVMFGPNARLDVRGSFHVSTADYLRL